MVPCTIKTRSSLTIYPSKIGMKYSLPNQREIGPYLITNQGVISAEVNRINVFLQDIVK